MTDPREMLARLNPTNVRFDVGRGGGVPELTNIDIAGALGMVPAGLGREVLEACWWPDGAALSRGKLRDALFALVSSELMRQSQKLTEAHLELMLTEAAVSWGNKSASPAQRLEVDRKRQKLAGVRAQSWPRNTLEHVEAIAGVILGEIQSGGRCKCCMGSRVQVIDLQMVKCLDCEGTGLDKQPVRQRAAAIGCDPSLYLRRWKPVYEWLAGKMLEAEQDAAHALASALKKDAA